MRGWLKRWRVWLVAGLLPFVCGTATAQGFAVREAKTRLAEGIFLLDARVDYRFSHKALEALYSGVPLTVRLDIEVQRKRRWWLDADVATLEQRYQLHYHALSDQFLLKNLNSGAIYAFHTLSGAVEVLGTIDDFPLLDARLIEPDEQYEVELRAGLDIESLPSPLRPLAYITPAWRLRSDWYTWSLTR